MRAPDAVPRPGRSLGSTVELEREKKMIDESVGDGLIKVSDLIIGHPEVRSFEDLKQLVVAAAKSGYRFLQFDVKPEFVDTPRNWDLALEAEFYRGDRTPS
jgi:hypothetical protein